jgi:hypothetical protein
LGGQFRVVQLSRPWITECGMTFDFLPGQGSWVCKEFDGCLGLLSRVHLFSSLARHLQCIPLQTTPLSEVSPAGFKARPISNAALRQNFRSHLSRSTARFLESELFDCWHGNRHSVPGNASDLVASHEPSPYAPSPKMWHRVNSTLNHVTKQGHSRAPKCKLVLEEVDSRFLEKRGVIFCATPPIESLSCDDKPLQEKLHVDSKAPHTLCPTCILSRTLYMLQNRRIPLSRCKRMAPPLPASVNVITSVPPSIIPESV